MQRRFLTTDFTDGTDKRKNQINLFLISVNPCDQSVKNLLRISAVKICFSNAIFRSFHNDQASPPVWSVSKSGFGATIALAGVDILL